MVTINQEGYKFTKIKVIIIEPTTSPCAEYTFEERSTNLADIVSTYQYMTTPPFISVGPCLSSLAHKGYCIPLRHNSMKPFEERGTWEHNERNSGNEAGDNEILARQV